MLNFYLGSLNFHPKLRREYTVIIYLYFANI